MAIESELVKHLVSESAVTDLVSTRIYKRRVLPEINTFPIIWIILVDENRDYNMAGQDGLVDADIDIHVYGDDTGTIDDVAQAIRGVTSGYSGTWGSTSIQSCFWDSRTPIDELPQFGKRYPKEGDRIQLNVKYNESIPAFA